MSLTVLMIIVYALIFFFGASVFSFLNVVIYRVPRKESFVSGRSHCPACGHTLNYLDMVPVLGWIFLRGRCRYCGARISPRYVLVELLGGFCAVLCTVQFGWNLRALLAFVFFAILTAVAFVDLDTMEIPDGFVIALLVPAVPAFFIFPEINWISRLIGFFSVSVILLIITLIVPGAFGGGDIKLMAVCGLFLGWQLTLTAFFLAVLTGGFYGIILLISRKKGRKDHFAFGPFLCLGMVIGFLWGERLLSSYLGLLL